MKHQCIDGILYFYFHGDLGDPIVCSLKQIYIDLIEKYQPKTIKLDFGGVIFVDNTGIGSILARHKQLRKLHAQLILCNPPGVSQTLFKMSGIFQTMKHERNEVKLRIR